MLLTILDGFLINRFSRNLVNGYFNEWLESDVGLPQGSILSSVLFLPFIGNLSADPANLNLQLPNYPSKHLPNESKYADDYNLWRSSKIIKQPKEELQRDLNIIMQWCLKWRININRQKAQVILFEKKNKKSSKIEMTVKSSVIKQVKQKKILGIIVDEKLTFKSYIEYICTKARKSYGRLVAIPMISPANYVTILKVQKSFIRSHLEYCCAAWSHKIYHNFHPKLLESTQRGALSLILRSFKYQLQQCIRSLAWHSINWY